MPKMKKLCAAAWIAALLALCLFGCSGEEKGYKLPERTAVESGERQFATPSDGDLIAIFDTSLGEVRAWPAPATMTAR